jgi:hypothetical protein
MKLSVIIPSSPKRRPALVITQAIQASRQPIITEVQCIQLNTQAAMQRFRPFGGPILCPIQPMVCFRQNVSQPAFFLD